MRSRTAVAAAATAAVLVLAPLTACGAVGTAIDCAQFAVDITSGAQQFSDAMADAGDDPQRALDALTELERDMNKLSDSTDNVDVKNAVDNLADQVTETKAALKGDKVPAPAPVVDAAAEVTKVCTPG